MDPIIAATWSEDGAVHDVCKALAPRFLVKSSIQLSPSLAPAMLSRSLTSGFFVAVLLVQASEFHYLYAMHHDYHLLIVE